MEEFLALSALLTGLSSLGKPDPLSVEGRMAKDYLRLIQEQFGPGFDELLAIYRGVASSPDPLAALLNDARFPGTPAEAAARQIVNIWLLSQYSTGSGLPDQDAGFFEKGFIWPEIKGHAIGFSHRSYGYWSLEP